MLETFKYLNGQYNTAPILHLDVVNLWNSLPENLVSAPTVNAFKNQIDKLWKDAPFTTDPNATNIYYTLYQCTKIIRKILMTSMTS